LCVSSTKIFVHEERASIGISALRVPGRFCILNIRPETLLRRGTLLRGEFFLLRRVFLAQEGNPPQSF
jgi:hypothetical protein